jgi:hypothetical protein
MVAWGVHEVHPEGPKRRTREGGSEWELIKILLGGDRDSNKMNTASNTRLRLTTQVGQDHAATGVLLVLGTNNQLHELENAAEHKPRASLTYTGQTGEHHRSDRSCWWNLEISIEQLLHRSGRCSSPVRSVQARKPQIYQTGLPSSKLTQTRNSSNTGQQRTHPNIHPSKTPTGVCTGQTDERHRSGRCGLGSRDEQHPRVNSPKSNSRSPESLHRFAQDFGDSRNTSWGVHSQDFVHQNFPNQEESKKSRQELL